MTRNIKPRRKIRRFTTEEDAAIRHAHENYEQLREIAKSLDRSYGVLRQRARLLGLKGCQYAANLFETAPDDLKQALLTGHLTAIEFRSAVKERRKTDKERRAREDEERAAEIINKELIDLSQPKNPAPWPDPTPEMLATPEFEAVWQCIKRWDINVPDVYGGYCEATGNHVRAILDALARCND